MPTGLKLIMFIPPGPVREPESTVPPVVVQVTVYVPSLADTTLILTDAAVTVGGENNQYNGVLTYTVVHILCTVIRYTHAVYIL